MEFPWERLPTTLKAKILVLILYEATTYWHFNYWSWSCRNDSGYHCRKKWQKNYLNYWKKLEPNLLSVTNGWSAAYGMFTKGEVPIVLSYVTSPAYHLEYEKTERYRTAVFQDGHYRQIEFAGILKGTKRIKLAREFIDFMLSEKFQNVKTKRLITQENVRSKHAKM